MLAKMLQEQERAFFMLGQLQQGVVRNDPERIPLGAAAAEVGPAGPAAAAAAGNSASGPAAEVAEEGDDEVLARRLMEEEMREFHMRMLQMAGMAPGELQRLLGDGLGAAVDDEEEEEEEDGMDEDDYLPEDEVDPGRSSCLRSPSRTGGR